MKRDDATARRVRQLLDSGASTEAVVAELLAATAGPGECRIRDGTHDDDYPDVRPVLNGDGLHWCCSYDHCTTAVAPLEPRRRP